MSKRVKDVICPFIRVSAGTPFCDNLVSGVPSCVVDNFYPDLSHEEMTARLKASLDAYPDLVICDHFRARARTEALYAHFPYIKSACFFGGLCVHPMVGDYSACSVDCSRFKSGV